jgi:hypothetical protein
MEPTHEKIDALENPHEWILQKKVDYAAFVPTVDGQNSKAEIRMMFVWPENEHDPTLVNNLVRMSQGEMMGVDFNIDKIRRRQHRASGRQYTPWTDRADSPVSAACDSLTTARTE